MERAQIAALVVSSSPAASVKVPDGPAAPLAPIAGKSVLGWVVDALLGASVRRVAVLAEQPTATTRDEVAQRSDEALIEFVSPSRNIAESVSFALDRLGSALTMRESAHVLILPAEAPQIETSELRALIETHVDSGAAATLLTATGTTDVADLVRNSSEPIITRDSSGRITSIDDGASSPAGILCVNAPLLIPALRRISSPSWRQPVPFAEIVQVLDVLGHPVTIIERPEVLQTIDSVTTRPAIEMALLDRVIAGWLDRGTSMPDPRQVTIDATATLGQGVRVLPGSVIEGATVIGDGAIIGPNTHLVDALIGARAVVAHSVVVEAEVEAREQLAPFSVLGSTPA